MNAPAPLIDSGADPWVIRHDGAVLYCHSVGDGIAVRRASRLADLGAARSVRVWSAPEAGPFSRELWAPELHRIDGGWAIYVAADDGDNANHRMVALARAGDDPLGPFDFVGKLALEPDRWAIDGTVLTLPDGRRYFVWSGWEGFENVAQHLYVCPMADPWTPSGPRVRISSPEHPWETRGSGGPGNLPTINEGPQVLVRAGRVHIVYSAAGSWCDDYCLGRLTLAPGGDPLDPAAWVKHPEPVFAKTEAIFGPGHASFVVGDDGRDWIVYHSARRSGSGWDRQVRAQPFGWDDDGAPIFGRPGVGA